MRCMLCESLSFMHICSSCQETFLSPSLYKRRLSNNIEVISFYKYNDIKELLHTKHTDIGYYIYSILARNSLQKFAMNFEYEHNISSIAVDDTVTSGYSHTAILNRSLKSKCIRPSFNKLRAKNTVSYSGKSKEYRITNPRDFYIKYFKCKQVILVDDIITTGSTLMEAVNTMELNKKQVLFCLTLADASIV